MFNYEESRKVTIENSSGWVVSIANTIAGGDLVQVTNSAGWIVNAVRSGQWIVELTGGGVNIINSSGWIFNQANTGGFFTLANSSNIASIILNSSNLNIANSSGWVVAQSNTDGGRINIINTAGISISNTAGWVINQANTANITTRDAYDTNKVWDGATELRMNYEDITVYNSGNTAVVLAVSSKRIRLMSAFLISKAANVVFWQSDSSGAVNLTGPTFIAASGGYVLPFNPNGWFQTNTSTLLNLSSGVATTIGGCITYLETS